MIRSRRAFAPLLVVLSVVAIAGCGEDEEKAEEPRQEAPAALDVALKTADGADAGAVTLTDDAAGVRVEAELTGLEPGFHGFHVHETGKCDPDAVVEGEPTPFGSAEGHYTKGPPDHGDHSGDFPPLLVLDDGSVRATVMTGRFKVADLQDQNGSAVMVHADRDNGANIPSDRYESKGGTGVPDEMTLATGDSGDRVACGLIEPK